MIRDDDDGPEEIADDLITHASKRLAALQLIHERADARAAAHMPVTLPPVAGISITRETEQRA